MNIFKVGDPVLLEKDARRISGWDLSFFWIDGNHLNVGFSLISFYYFRAIISNLMPNLCLTVFYCWLFLQYFQYCTHILPSSHVVRVMVESFATQRQFYMSGKLRNLSMQYERAIFKMYLGDKPLSEWCLLGCYAVWLQLATDVRCEEIGISSQRTSVASCSLCCS
jgi:hypothetical protein